MKVLKFGGSSLVDYQAFQKVVSIIVEQELSSGLIVVLSAPSNVTNLLDSSINHALNGSDYVTCLSDVRSVFEGILNSLVLSFSNSDLDVLRASLNERLLLVRSYLDSIALLNLCPDKIQAFILAQGEVINATIFRHYLLLLEHNFELLSPESLLISLDDGYLDVLVDFDSSLEFFTDFDLNGLYLSPGFFAGNVNHEIVLLGRNGSDYSAALYAACTGSEVCEIWTDVDGVYSIDPRIVPDSPLIPALTYQQAFDMSHLGAKVLHPKTIKPLESLNIPVRIRNTFNPSFLGTMIGYSLENPLSSFLSLTHIDKVSVVSIQTMDMDYFVLSNRLNTLMSRLNVSYRFCSRCTSLKAFSFVIDSIFLDLVLDRIYKHFNIEFEHKEIALHVVEDQAIFSCIYSNNFDCSSVPVYLFKILSLLKIKAALSNQSACESVFSVVVPSDSIHNIIFLAYQLFFGAKNVVNIFVLGIGSIGRTLLSQISRQQLSLYQKGLDIRVVGFANSKKYLFDKNGLILSNMDIDFEVNASNFSLDGLLDCFSKVALVNPVLVDCTSSDVVANAYISFLKQSIHIVTPSKKANTLSCSYYRDLFQAVYSKQIKYLYETSVGAGLPIVSTLQQLVLTGDKIRSFKGILSGSLSYIFGCLDDGLSFSKAVRLAFEQNFTEPDPRDDLSGMDVARKILILAREIGFNLELSDIDLVPVLPDFFDFSGDLDSFWARLPELDSYFETMVLKKPSYRLRYVGQFVDSKLKVSIEFLSDDDALFHVKSGENSLSILSHYYSPVPLVIRGYGAGKDVTASGVFSDILKISGFIGG